jgi:hypothetical protein
MHGCCIELVRAAGVGFFAPQSSKFRTMTTRVQTAITVVWGPIIAGVFVTLVMHVLLSMLGAGIGTALIDVRTYTLNEVHGLSWAAFAWWSISGIIAAFVGGWAAVRLASALSPDFSISPDEGAVYGFLAWAVATVLIVAFAALAVGTIAAIAGVLFPPISITRLAANAGTAQTVFATFILASLGALIIGALAASWAGRLAARRKQFQRPDQKRL